MYFCFVFVCFLNFVLCMSIYHLSVSETNIVPIRRGTTSRNPTETRAGYDHNVLIRKKYKYLRLCCSLS